MRWISPPLSKVREAYMRAANPNQSEKITLRFWESNNAFFMTADKLLPVAPPEKLYIEKLAKLSYGLVHFDQMIDALNWQPGHADWVMRGWTVWHREHRKAIGGYVKIVSGDTEGVSICITQARARLVTRWRTFAFAIEGGQVVGSGWVFIFETSAAHERHNNASL